MDLLLPSLDLITDSTLVILDMPLRLKPLRKVLILDMVDMASTIAEDLPKDHSTSTSTPTVLDTIDDIMMDLDMASSIDTTETWTSIPMSPTSRS